MDQGSNRAMTSFSQERMTYIPEESKGIYQSKDGKKGKAFDALEWHCPVK